MEVDRWQEKLGQRAPLILMVAFMVVASSVACAAYDVWRQRRIIIDDAFISYRYARHWVDGQGLVFNPGERVQGYSNFLWVLVAAAALALGGDPLATTQALGIAAFIACVALSSAVTFLSAPRRVPAAVSAAPALLFYVLPAGFAALAGTGLETSFLALVLLGMGLLNHLWPPQGRALRLVACFLPLLAVLTRLDSVLVVLASALVHFFSSATKRDSLRAAALATLGRFGLSAVGLAVLLVWQLWYYDALLPNTYWAKGADFAPTAIGVRYLIAFFRHAPWVLFLAPVALWGAFWTRPGRARFFGIFLLAALVLHMAYCVKVGGDFMQYRMMWEVTPLFITLVVMGLRALPSRFFALTCVLIGLPLATVETHLELQHEMHGTLQMDEYTRFGARVGKALSTLPPDTLVATTMVGTVGYYSLLPILDEWGLTDRYVAHLPIRSFGGRGHIKRAPRQYLDQRRVQLYLGHPVPLACNQRAAGDGPAVLLRIGNDECVRLGYLHRTAALTDFFCEQRSRFILHDVGCPRGPF